MSDSFCSKEKPFFLGLHLGVSGKTQLESLECESNWQSRQTIWLGEHFRGTRQSSTGVQFLDSTMQQSPELTLVRWSCPSHLGHRLSPSPWRLSQTQGFFFFSPPNGKVWLCLKKSEPVLSHRTLIIGSWWIFLYQVNWYGACFFFFYVHIFCPEGQRGAEGGNGLANGPANFLRDHCQHVLLWRWVLWAWRAVLTIGTLQKHHFLWHQHQYWYINGVIRIIWVHRNAPFKCVWLKFHNHPPFIFLCLIRSIWWWVGGGIQQRWERHGSRRALRWRVQFYVSTVFVSWDSWGLN